MKYDYTKFIPDSVKTLLQQVEDLSEGYDVYLGGGFLRDLYCCVNEWDGREDLVEIFFEPKDIDLFFVPNGEPTKTLPTLSKSYINYDKSAEDITEDMAARGVVALRGMMVSGLRPTHDVQFIVYGKQMAMEELASDMDCNINQVMYSLSKGWYQTDEFTSGHDNQTIQLLHTFDEDRMIARLVRMSRKFDDYSVDSDLDWEIYDNDPEYVPERGGSFCEED